MYYLISRIIVYDVMKINEIMCAFGLKSIQFTVKRNFEVMLIESFSSIQSQIEYVTNSKTEMEMLASFYNTYFKAFIFQFTTETLV